MNCLTYKIQIKSHLGNVKFVPKFMDIAIREAQELCHVQVEYSFSDRMPRCVSELRLVFQLLQYMQTYIKRQLEMGSMLKC